MITLSVLITTLLNIAINFVIANKANLLIAGLFAIFVKVMDDNRKKNPSEN